MTVNMVNSTTSNVNKKLSACVYNQQKRMGCPAHMTVKEYPDYRITEEENKSLRYVSFRKMLLTKH